MTNVVSWLLSWRIVDIQCNWTAWLIAETPQYQPLDRIWSTDDQTAPSTCAAHLKVIGKAMLLVLICSIFLPGFVRLPKIQWNTDKHLAGNSIAYNPPGRIDNILIIWNSNGLNSTINTIWPFHPVAAVQQKTVQFRVVQWAGSDSSLDWRCSGWQFV